MCAGDKKRCSSAKRNTTSTALKVAMASRQLSDSTNSIERRASKNLKLRHQQLTACCYEICKVPSVTAHCAGLLVLSAWHRRKTKTRTSIKTTQHPKAGVIANLHLRTHLKSPESTTYAYIHPISTHYYAPSGHIMTIFYCDTCSVTNQRQAVTGAIRLLPSNRY